MTTTDNTTTETEALILAGDGYQLTIAPEAFALRERALTKAANIVAVTSHDESYEAGHRVKEIAALRNLVERSRKAVKEPVLEVGRRIDQAAKDFLADLNAEEGRIKQLIEGHAYRLAEERRIAEEAERRAAAEARAAREAAEAAQQAAQTTGRIADVVAAQQAEQSRIEALATRCAAADETHAAKQPDEVRWKWDFEVSDIRKLASIAPALVRMEPAVIEIRRKIAEAVEKHDDPALIAEIFAEVGITVFRKPEVRTR
jgi:hypothetical protein